MDEDSAHTRCRTRFWFCCLLCLGKGLDMKNRWLSFLSLMLLLLSDAIFISAQTKVSLSILSNVQFVVTDPAGRKSGADPRYSKASEQWTRFDQIPNSRYGETYYQEDEPPKIEFETYLRSPGQEGTFTIEIIGDSTRSTSLVIDVVSSLTRSQVQQPYYEIAAIPIEKDSAITFQFTYHCAPGDSVGLVKVVSAISLVQDIAVMRKLGWIKNQRTADAYQALIWAYNEQLHQSHALAVRAALTAIMQKIASDSLDTLSVEARNSLRQDIEYLSR